jgi:homoserine dehydrogenase
MVGRMLFYGRGAGQGPAASAVVSDIVGLARRLQGEAGTVAPFNPSLRHVKGMRRLDDIKVRYYVRFSAIDKPGVLAKISGILGRYNISIASVVQKERKKAKIVPLVMMTHEVRERDMRKALQKIDLLPLVRRKTIAIRVESVDQ